MGNLLIEIVLNLKFTQRVVPLYKMMAIVGFSLAFGINILFLFHLYLLFTNKTTIECGIDIVNCSAVSETL